MCGFHTSSCAMLTDACPNSTTGRQNDVGSLALPELLRRIFVKTAFVMGDRKKQGPNGLGVPHNSTNVGEIGPSFGRIRTIVHRVPLFSEEFVPGSNMFAMMSANFDQYICPMSTEFGLTLVVSGPSSVERDRRRDKIGRGRAIFGLIRHKEWPLGEAGDHHPGPLLDGVYDFLPSHIL